MHAVLERHERWLCNSAKVAVVLTYIVAVCMPCTAAYTSKYILTIMGKATREVMHASAFLFLQGRCVGSDASACLCKECVGSDASARPREGGMMLCEVMPARCVQSDASSAFSGTESSITRRFTLAMLLGWVLTWKRASDRKNRVAEACVCIH